MGVGVPAEGVGGAVEHLRFGAELDVDLKPDDGVKAGDRLVEIHEFFHHFSSQSAAGQLWASGFPSPASTAPATRYI